MVLPVRATTPGADERTWPEETAVGNAIPSSTASDPAAAKHLPQLPRRVDGEISYENQGTDLCFFKTVTNIFLISTSC
jgi:hypothetical protein